MHAPPQVESRAGILRSAWQLRKLTLGVAVLAVTIGGLILHYAFRPTVPPMITVPLTTFTGRELQPSFSPDGRNIAFDSRLGGGRGQAPASLPS